MADFTNRQIEKPDLGQFSPRTVRNIGSILSGIGQGAGTLLSSTLRGPEHNLSSRGVRATIVVSGKTGTISAVFTIRRLDPASGTWIDMLSSSAITADGVTTMIVHPDLTAVANSIAKDFIGEQFDVKLVSGPGSTPSFNFTVGVELLP